MESYIENPKDPHRKLIKRKGDMKVNEKTSININKVLRSIFSTVINTFRRAMM